MPSFVLWAVVFSALLHAAWNAVLRFSPDRNLTVTWIGFSAFVIASPVAMFLGVPSRAWPYVLASGSIHLLYLLLLSHAYKLSELSFAYPIARGSSPMLVALGGLAFASESPSRWAWTGIALIAAGIVMIGAERRAWDSRNLAIALTIGGIISVYTVIDAIGARLSQTSVQYNACEFALYGLGVMAIQFGTLGPGCFVGPARAMRLGFLGGVASVVAYAIVVWGMVRAPMGSVSAIRETSTLFAALMAYVFLKERFSVQKVAGSCSIVIGAALIGLRL